jgi:tetratricopeptide (TPR) repeat protein
MTRGLWENYIRSGKSFTRLRDFDQGERMLKAALKVAEEWGPKDPRLGVTLSNLARLYQAQGRFAEAEALYNRALAIAESEHGPDHVDTGVGLSNLAALYSAQKRFAEAEPLFQRALAIMEKAMGRDHPSVATILTNYATMLRKADRVGEAEHLEIRVLDMRLKEGEDLPKGE